MIPEGPLEGECGLLMFCDLTLFVVSLWRVCRVLVMSMKTQWNLF